MRFVSEEQLERALAALAPAEPRVVASGNHATPLALLGALERARERYRLFMLAAQGQLPQREGVIFETPFVGPAMRDAGARLDYLPMRLSLVPRLFGTLRPPDVLLLHTSRPHGGRVSLGIEVNVLPAALESVRARGGLVVAQVNPAMPYTFGDGELDEQLIDLALEAEQELPVPAVRPGHEHAERIAELVAELVQGRRDAAARDRAGPRRDAPRADGAAAARGVVGDDQRRRDGARARRVAGSRAPDPVLVHVRLARAL